MPATAEEEAGGRAGSDEDDFLLRFARGLRFGFSASSDESFSKSSSTVFRGISAIACGNHKKSFEVRND